MLKPRSRRHDLHLSEESPKPIRPLRTTESVLSHPSLTCSRSAKNYWQTRADVSLRLRRRRQPLEQVNLLRHADVAQPVEQRFRKLPVPVRPAITKNQAKRRIDGRQAPNPSPRTPIPLYAHVARSRRGFFWLDEIVRASRGSYRDASTASSARRDARKHQYE